VNIENLRQFVQIVEIGSVQGAARRLGVSRSVVRRALEELEAEVGAPLLHRDPVGVRLTAAGAVLLDGARPLLESARSLLTDARAAEQEARGVIRVIEPVGLPMAMHVSAILAAHALMPNQRIVIRHAENPLTELNHPFELMLHEGPPPDRNNWFSRVVIRVRLRPVASRGYLARRGAPKRVEDLAEHDTLGWNRPGHPGGEWPLLAGGAVAVNPWFASSDPQLLATLAARDGGIFLAPNMPFFEGAEVEPMEPVLEDQIGTEIVFRATTPFPTRADPRTRDTVAMIAAQLEALPQD
jgi:DNA-binding transcriptional LysR family regulator